MSLVDRIKPESCSIYTFMENLLKGVYQIPTFQRKIVWDKDNVKYLWDSIFNFYPIGSILLWRTDTKLQDHRAISGHVIKKDIERTEYLYILDGQQRTNSILSAIEGGEIEGKGDFDPTLYVDISKMGEDEEDIDYRDRFLFWDEIDDTKLKRNAPKKRRFEGGLIIRLKDIKEDFEKVESKLIENGYTDYSDEMRQNLRELRRVFDNYRIATIELRGITVPEVCVIFRRINIAGKDLDIFDIVVAKTYRQRKEDCEGFYLRELVDNFKERMIGGNFENVDDKTFLQMLGVLITENLPESGVWNVTDRYLNEIETEHIEAVWDEAQVAMLKLFDYFDNHMRLKGPALIPFRYFYMTLVSYFYGNPKPDYDLLRKYYWFYSFHDEELLRNTTHMKSHIRELSSAKNGGDIKFPKFIIDKQALRTASYSSRGRLSRAILSLFSSQEPKDWKHVKKSVINEVYYLLTDKPNLHHVFPVDYIDTNPGENRLDKDSLMNIVYLPQITNIEIGNKNPIQYIKDYPYLPEILDCHLLPYDLVKWANQDSSPKNALDLFIEERVENVIRKLKEELSGVEMEAIDIKTE